MFYFSRSDVAYWNRKWDTAMTYIFSNFYGRVLLCQLFTLSTWTFWPVSWLFDGLGPSKSPIFTRFDPSLVSFAPFDKVKSRRSVPLRLLIIHPRSSPPRSVRTAFASPSSRTGTTGSSRRRAAPPTSSRPKRTSSTSIPTTGETRAWKLLYLALNVFSIL